MVSRVVKKASQGETVGRVRKITDRVGSAAAATSVYAEAMSDADAPSQDELRASVPPPVRRGTILVIDDNELVARTIQRLLREHHDVVTERDPEAAVARLVAGERFDAVLCELRMPKLSGIQVYATIRAANRATAERLIFMSGCVLDEDTEFFLQASQAQFLEKPFRIHLLRAAVNGFVH